MVYNIFEKLYKEYPLLFSDLVPSYYHGKCKEGEFSCGKPHIFKNFVDNIK